LARLWRGGGGGPASAPRLDNITLNMCARRVARAQKRMGDEEEAKATLDAVYDYFKRSGLKEHVLRRIREQADKTLKETY